MASYCLAEFPGTAGLTSSCYLPLCRNVPSGECIYEAATQEDNTIRAVAYSTFCRLWRSLLPSVIIMKPMTDLCLQCQKNSSAILRSANLTKSEKSDTLRVAEEHLRVVQDERSFYRSSGRLRRVLSVREGTL